MAWLTYNLPGRTEPKVPQLPEGRCTIGRDAGCDLVLDDKAASRIHAVLEPGPGGWTVQDVESRNGTFLNDERVSTARLGHGDRLRIGAVQLRFEDPPVVELPAPAEASRHRRPSGLWLSAGGAVLAGLAVLGFLAGRSAARIAPAPARVEATSAQSVPAPEPLKLDLVLRAKASYDQAFDGGDQEWAVDQELVLEAKDIPLSAGTGPFTGTRRSREGTDQIRGILEGGRIKALQWHAVRVTTRSMADGHEEKAREEAWEFNAETLSPVPGAPRTCVWRASPSFGAIPALAHTLTFHPQNVTVRLVNLEWPTGLKKGAEAPATASLHP